jgi:hypothetical protein
VENRGSFRSGEIPILDCFNAFQHFRCDSRARPLITELSASSPGEFPKLSSREDGYAGLSLDAMKRVQTNSSFDVQFRPFARHSCVAPSRSVNDVEVCSASVRWLSFSEASEDETANYR